MLVSAPLPLIPSAAPASSWTSPWLVFVLPGLELFTAPKIRHAIQDPVFLIRLDPALGGRQSQAALSLRVHLTRLSCAGWEAVRSGATSI